MPDKEKRPDLSKAKLVPPSEFDRKVQKTPATPVSAKAEDMRKLVQEVLSTIEPPTHEHGRPDHGDISKGEARAILTAAIKALDADKTLTFAEEDRSVNTRLTDDPRQRGTVEPGGFSYEAKVSDHPSDQGIDSGVVVELAVYDFEGSEVARYDRGWDKEPESGAEKAVQQIIAFYRENMNERSGSNGYGWTNEAEKEAAIKAEREARESRDSAAIKEIDDNGHEM